MRNRIASDIGGTFTDIVLESGERRFSSKVLTTINAPEQGVLTGIDQVLRDAGLSAGDIDLLIHGTTLATNALIERKGAKTAFITTRGFRDVLETAYEKRFDQNRVFLDKPQPLVPRMLRFSVAERIAADGEVLLPLDEQAVSDLAGVLQAQQVESLAIGFLHAYAFPVHEQKTRALLQSVLPQMSMSLSSEVCPEMREYERFSTTCANAYIQPLMQGYLKRLQQRLQQSGFICPLLLMSSGGGLTPLEHALRFPIRLVESGPAGGALLAAHIAKTCGLDKVLSFDMGGTTAKICLLENAEPQRARRFEVARIYRHMKGSGLPLRIPAIEMVEIGAGGGSIARVDGLGRIVVGPDSAGASPGPACYDQGGLNATVTDANLVLGKLDFEYFAGGKIKLNRSLAQAAIAEQIGEPSGLRDFWPAAGVNEIVDENMANAARVHAIERGKNISEQTLVAFGGGAPLHAARLAQKLGIAKVIIPSGAGVGSALGFLHAPVAYEIVRSYKLALTELYEPRVLQQCTDMLEEMRRIALDVVLPAAGNETIETISETRQVDVRYIGQGHEIQLPLPTRELHPDDIRDLQAAFDKYYRKKYGLIISGQSLEMVTCSVHISTTAADPLKAKKARRIKAPVAPASRFIFDAKENKMIEAAIYRRSELLPGMHLSGPALIAEEETSTLVPCGFSLSIDGNGYLILENSAV